MFTLWLETDVMQLTSARRQRALCQLAKRWASLVRFAGCAVPPGFEAAYAKSIRLEHHHPRVRLSNQYLLIAAPFANRMSAGGALPS